MEKLPPELIIHEIFTWLPVASLLRFKCVSKSYNALISSPKFIDLHLRRSHCSDSNRLLLLFTRTPDHLSLLDVDLPNPASTVLEIPLPYALDELSDDECAFLCSFNGLLCVGRQRYYTHMCDEIVLINPCTRVYWSIPRSNCSSRKKTPIHEYWERFGLGFDDINNDYKLVRVAVNDVRLGTNEARIRNREVTVYSLKENTWKLIEDVDDTPDFYRQEQNCVVLKNHLLHWVFLNKHSSRYHIWCFDVLSNKWTTEVPLMDLFACKNALVSNNAVKGVLEVKLGVFHGCLCLSARVKSHEEVWMMKEYGVKESWVKLFEISVATPRGCRRSMVPIGFRKESNHEVLIHERDVDQENRLFLCDSEEEEDASKRRPENRLFWCDTRQDSSDCWTKEIVGVFDFDQVFYFKGSLVTIPDGYRIEELRDLLLSDYF